MFEIFFLGDLKPFKCPGQWVAYAGHCYRIYRTPKIWKEAQSSCRREDGELASIHNIEEYSFTVSQLGYSEYSCRSLFYLELYCCYHSFNHCNHDLKCFLKSPSSVKSGCEMWLFHFKTYPYLPLPLCSQSQMMSCGLV